MCIGAEQAAPAEAIAAVPERAACSVPVCHRPRAVQRSQHLRHRIGIAVAGGQRQGQEQALGGKGMGMGDDL